MSAVDKSSDDSKFKAELAKRIGIRIRSIRKAKGYKSAEKFALAHNLNRTQYSRYEKGRDLQVSTLGRLIGALGVSFAEFFSEGFEGCPI